LRGICNVRAILHIRKDAHITSVRLVALQPVVDVQLHTYAVVSMHSFNVMRQFQRRARDAGCRHDDSDLLSIRDSVPSRQYPTDAADGG